MFLHQIQGHSVLQHGALPFVILWHHQEHLSMSWSIFLTKIVLIDTKTVTELIINRDVSSTLQYYMTDPFNQHR